MTSINIASKKEYIAVDVEKEFAAWNQPLLQFAVPSSSDLETMFEKIETLYRKDAYISKFTTEGAVKHKYTYMKPGKIPFDHNRLGPDLDIFINASRVSAPWGQFILAGAPQEKKKQKSI